MTFVDKLLAIDFTRQRNLLVFKILFWFSALYAGFFGAAFPSAMIPTEFLLKILGIFLLVSLSFLVQIVLPSGLIHKRLQNFGYLVEIFATFLLVVLSGRSNSIWQMLYLVTVVFAGLSLSTAGTYFVSLGCMLAVGLQEIVLNTSANESNLLYLLINYGAFLLIANLTGHFAGQLREAEEKIEVTEEYSSALLDMMPVALVSFREDGTLLKASRIAKEFFPKLKDQIDFIEFLPEYRSDVENLEFNRGEKRFRAQFRKSWHPILKADAYVGVIEDVTSLRKMESALRQSEKMAAIGGLAAGIAHEIRNPLTGISGSIQLLSQTIQSEDDKKLMKIILREIDRLNALITEFLDYSKPDKSPSGIVELSQLLKEVISQLRTMKILPEPVKEVLEIEDDMAVIGDRDKLKQAFLNILINSYQAMDKGSDNVLFVRLFRESGEIKLKIRDNGCGMKEDTRKRMFEPFHTTKAKGTGLGLAITYKILEVHRVRVDVESELGRGTEFTMTFHTPNKE